MIQQKIQAKGGRNIKKLLAELANRQLNWREEKTREIITSQKYGLNVTSTLKIDYSKNQKELPTVKSTNTSVKHIQVKSQSKQKKQVHNTTEFDNNGNVYQSKRSITEKNSKMTPTNRNKTVQDQNLPPKQEKQRLLPKLNTLKKKTSIEYLRRNTGDRQRGIDGEYLSIIEQQESIVLKKETQIKTCNTHQRDIF